MRDAVPQVYAYTESHPGPLTSTNSLDTMPGNRCVFRNCSNIRTKGLKMFTFPRDIYTANIWVANSDAVPQVYSHTESDPGPFTTTNSLDTMPGNRCVFRNCSNIRTKGLKMFSFPQDIDTAKIWVANSGNAELIALSPELLVKKVICEKHFQEKDILSCGRLIKGAVPEVYPFTDSDPDPFANINSSSPASPRFNHTLASPNKHAAKKSELLPSPSMADTVVVKEEDESCQEPAPECSTGTVCSQIDNDVDQPQADIDFSQTNASTDECVIPAVDSSQEPAPECSTAWNPNELDVVDSGLQRFLQVFIKGELNDLQKAGECLEEVECSSIDPLDITEMKTVAVKEKDSSQKPTPGCSTACSPNDDDDDFISFQDLCLEYFRKEAHDLKKARERLEDVDCSSSGHVDATEEGESEPNMHDARAAMQNCSNDAEATSDSCAQCNYQSPQFTMKHFLNHNAKKFFNLESFSTSDFKKSIETCNGEKKLFCEFCKGKLNKSSKVKSRLRTQNVDKEQTYSGDKHICVLCKRKLNKLKSHLRRRLERLLRAQIARNKPKRTAEKHFCCEFCKSKFSDSSYFKRHLRTQHADKKPFCCELCDYKCSDPKFLKDHLKTHKDEKPFSCEFCDRKCKSAYLLKAHLRTHTGEKLCCELCDFKCSAPSYLRSHLKKHTGDTIICEICGFRCTELSSLRGHRKTHSDEKPFSCKFCEFNCKDSLALKRHNRTHTDKKPFSCELCEFKTSQQSYLKKHLKTHTGEKPFNCKLCDYKFRRSFHLAAHMRTHTGEMPYSCKLCDFRCAQIGSIQYHFRKHHKDEDHSKLYDYKCSTN
ncbi:oocyte zinc finger protein XlCOF22 isoform X2 [Nilaparvata lugens]|uniref:oocyte zinc finger protein XlCOF22 isoform X2 n=1 Tax=Nilaparvata lugens TaxID=108931 RepID=UPI00193CF0E0|nr:oocyte zinc finger protein XlCOF22 isoform X2 [Nilaparvata lugens]